MSTRSGTCRGGDRGDTWQILVSEFMLQQTPVARVEPIWRDWVRAGRHRRRRPPPRGRRAARLGQARLPEAGQALHECATVIATEHVDVVPADVEPC